MIELPSDCKFWEGKRDIRQNYRSYDQEKSEKSLDSVSLSPQCSCISNFFFLFPFPPFLSLQLTSYWHSLKYSKPHRFLLTCTLGPHEASPWLLCPLVEDYHVRVFLCFNTTINKTISLIPCKQVFIQCC